MWDEEAERKYFHVEIGLGQGCVVSRIPSVSPSMEWLDTGGRGEGVKLRDESGIWLEIKYKCR